MRVHTRREMIRNKVIQDKVGVDFMGGQYEGISEARLKMILACEEVFVNALVRRSEGQVSTYS